MCVPVSIRYRETKPNVSREDAPDFNELKWTSEYSSGTHSIKRDFNWQILTNKYDTRSTWIWLSSQESRRKNHKELLKAKSWYDSVYPLPSRFEKIEIAAQKKQYHKTSGNELNIKTESLWLKIILIQSFLFFIFLPYLCFKYFHLFLNLKNRVFGYRFLKSWQVTRTYLKHNA